MKALRSNHTGTAFFELLAAHQKLQPAPPRTAMHRRAKYDNHDGVHRIPQIFPWQLCSMREPVPLYASKFATGAGNVGIWGLSQKYATHPNTLNEDKSGFLRILK